MSDSVVFAEPGDATAGGGCVWTGGAEGAREGWAGGGVATAGGLVELGLLVHASSSKPDDFASAELLRGGVPDFVGLSKAGEPERGIWSEAASNEMRSTVVDVLDLGVGLPRRGALSSPLEEANRLGGGVLSFCSARAISSSFLICSCRESFLANFSLIIFVTRIMSPSRRPRERMVTSVISGRML